MPDSQKTDIRSHSPYSYLLMGAGLFALIQAFSLLSPIILSFLLILLISMAVNPVVSRMRAWTGGRKGATALVLATLVAVIALTGWAFSRTMSDAAAKLSERLPSYWERLQKPLIKMEQQAVLSEQKLQAEVSSEIAQTAKVEGKPQNPRGAAMSTAPKTTKEPESIRSKLSQMIQGVVGSFTAVAFNAAQILVVMVTVFFGVIFTLMNPRPIFSAIFLIVPEQHHEQVLIILQRVGKFVPTWALATLTAMVTVGILVFLLMLPFFGFMDALVLGTIAGVFEVIPYLGPILSAVPALLFALGEGGMTAIWVLLAYLAVQVLENNVIAPMIMARSMKLHSVAVIFSMLLCVAAFGVLGVLVASPLVAIVDIVHDELYRKRFLSMVTPADLENYARKVLGEKQSTTITSNPD